jgi:DNA invertase Pin-like site-specific DNA recombinase
MSTSNRQLECEPLIPAVGYLRKSTKGERKSATGERRQKQEKSLPQQREEIIKLARGRYEIVKWFEDEGISGWKRGAKRPDFQRMIEEASSLGAQAILCDNIDRFSRATYDDVQEDAGSLRKAGVRWIVTASHGEFDLGHRNDIAEIIKFAAAVWAAHEYSRNLGRRIARARRDAAEEGKRTGGAAPYGLANDGEGGLKHGDPDRAEVVRWLFDQFGNHRGSLNGMAGDLNRRGVPGPSGGPWYPKTIALLLRQRAYRGDFLFNRDHRGQFFGIDAKGEVVEHDELNVAGKVFDRSGAYESLVEPALFDKVQRRLDALAGDAGRRNRKDYALTGVLVCDHCGLPMFATRVKRKNGRRSPTVYRCNGNSRFGLGTCKQYQIREDAILPFVLQTLGEEIADLTSLYGTPPEELRSPQKERAEQHEKMKAGRDKLAGQIERAEENLLFVEDSRTRKSLDARISTMRDELDRLDAELAAEPEGQDHTGERLAALVAWWDEFLAGAITLPTRYWLENPDNPDEHLNLTVAVDPRKVNEALLDLGCEVRLRWKTEKYISMTYKDKDGTRRGGVERTRHVLDRGRFRLGRQKGEIKGNVADTTACPSGWRPWPARRGGRRSRRTARGPARSGERRGVSEGSRRTRSRNHGKHGIQEEKQVTPQATMELLPQVQENGSLVSPPEDTCTRPRRPTRWTRKRNSARTSPACTGEKPAKTTSAPFP